MTRRSACSGRYWSGGLPVIVGTLSIRRCAAWPPRSPRANLMPSGRSCMTWSWLDRFVSSGSRTLRSSLRRPRSGNGSTSSSIPSKVPADPARTTAPPTEALVVHVFVAADGTDQAADLAHVEKIWQACGESLGMTGAVPGAGVEWDGTLAARTRPGSGVYQAVLRREHDVFCLSAVLE